MFYVGPCASTDNRWCFTLFFTLDEFVEIGCEHVQLWDSECCRCFDILLVIFLLLNVLMCAVCFVRTCLESPTWNIFDSGIFWWIPHMRPAFWSLSLCLMESLLRTIKRNSRFFPHISLFTTNSIVRMIATIPHWECLLLHYLPYWYVEIKFCFAGCSYPLLLILRQGCFRYTWIWNVSFDL